MITVMRFSRKLKNPDTVLMAVPAKSGDPRGLDVLQNLTAETVDLRKLEIRVLRHEIAHLLVEGRQTVAQSDDLLHEQIAEQTEHHAKQDTQHQQRRNRSERTLPAMLDQRNHHSAWP